MLELWRPLPPTTLPLAQVGRDGAYLLGECEVDGVHGGEVVLEVAAHVGVVYDRGDARLLEVLPRPDAGPHGTPGRGP